MYWAEGYERGFMLVPMLHMKIDGTLVQAEHSPPNHQAHEVVALLPEICKRYYIGTYRFTNQEDTLDPTVYQTLGPQVCRVFISVIYSLLIYVMT